MADYSLQYNPLFFGQFTLIRDFAAHWHVLHRDRKKITVRHYYVGSNVAGASSIVVPDPTSVISAYLAAVGRLCREGSPVFVFSHFIHKDSPALMQLGELRSAFPHLKIVVILHCTRDEFLRPGSGTASPEDARARRRASRAAGFRDCLVSMAGGGPVDALIAVSRSARRSYIRNGDLPPLEPGLIEVIANGVDIERFRIPTIRQKERYRSVPGIPEGVVLGCTNRWTRAKGKDILEALLDRLEREIDHFPVVFLFPLIVHDQLFRFVDSLPNRYPKMYAGNRIRGFLDISGLIDSPFRCSRSRIEHRYYRDIRNQPLSIRRVFQRISLGLIEFPVYWMLDIFLRPSIAEAFGLSMVEAYACGIPVIGSDRGGCGEIILPDHQVRYPDVLALAGDSENPTRRDFQGAVNMAAGIFFRRIVSIGESPEPARCLRQRMVKAGFTTRRVIGRYNKLIRRFL